MQILEGEIYRPERKYPLPSSREAFWLPIAATAVSVVFWGTTAYGLGRSFGAW